MSKTRARTHWYVFLAQVLIISVLALRSSYQDAAANETDPPTRVEHRGDLPGPLSFQPAGASEPVRAIANRPLRAGDRLWNGGGDPRAELTTGVATVRLDASPGLAFNGLDGRFVQMLLVQWTVTVRVQRPYGDEIIEVDTLNWAFSIPQAGSHRLEASEGGPSALVTIRVGESPASGGGDTYTVNPGQSTSAGTDHPETALKTLQISVKTYEEVKSLLAESGIVGLPAEDFPALPRFDKVPHDTAQLSGFIDSPESVRRGSEVASAVPGVSVRKGLIVK